MGGSNFVTLGVIPDASSDGVTGASISLAATGTVIAPTTGKRIFVHAMHLVATASVAVTVQDVSASATANLTGPMALAAGVPLVLPWQQYPHYSCASGDALVFSQGTFGVQLSGRIIYVQG
jgi:hypothetical protein